MSSINFRQVRLLIAREKRTMHLTSLAGLVSSLVLAIYIGCVLRFHEVYKSFAADRMQSKGSRRCVGADLS